MLMQWPFNPGIFGRGAKKPRGFGGLLGRSISVTLCTVFIAAGNGGEATEIYRWIDEHGRVHYGDRPHDNAESIDVTPPRIGDQELQRRHKRRQKIVSEYARERNEKATAAAADKAEKTRMARNCAIAKENLWQFENSARVVQRDDAGNRTVLDGDVYDAAHGRLRTRVGQWCQ